MPHNFIIIFLENDAPLMARGNINFTDTTRCPPASPTPAQQEWEMPGLSSNVDVPFRQCRGEGQSEAGGRVLQEDPEPRQPGGQRFWRQAGEISINTFLDALSHDYFPHLIPPLPAIHFSLHFIHHKLSLPFEELKSVCLSPLLL